MVSEIKNLNEIPKACEDSVGYMIGLVLFDGQHFNRFYLTNNFPDSEILRSLKAVKDLAVIDLERPFAPPEPKQKIIPGVEDITDITPDNDVKDS
jgi:hypothetical protein